MSIMVIVADDDILFREGLCLLIGGEEDMEVVGRTGETEGLTTMVQWLDPDVLVLAVDMIRGDGFVAGKRVRAGSPDLPILALVSQPTLKEREEVARAGFAGYLGKICTSEDLREAIRTLSRGGDLFSDAANP